MTCQTFVALPSGRTVCWKLPPGTSGADIKDLLLAQEGFPHDALRVVCDGRELDDDAVLPLNHAAVLRVHLRLPGGKGGFGSMLRAMGAMKSGKETDNIDACRGLDGRRLRHVEDERKIAEWVAKEPERRDIKARRKAAKLERKLAVPKHTFDHHGLTVELHEQSASVDEAVRAAFGANRMALAGGAPVPSALTAVQAEPAAKRRRMHWDDASSSSSSSAGSASEAEADDASVPAVADVTLLAPAPALEVNIVVLVPPGAPEHPQPPPVCEKRVFVRGPDVTPADLDLDLYDDVAALTALGADRLKAALLFRGAKCGGGLEERATRLFSLKVPSYLRPAKKHRSRNDAVESP